MDEVAMSLAIGPLSSWPDEWLDRAAHLCVASIANAVRAGATVETGLRDELSMFEGERHRRTALLD